MKNSFGLAVFCTLCVIIMVLLPLSISASQTQTRTLFQETNSSFIFTRNQFHPLDPTTLLALAQNYQPVGLTSALQFVNIKANTSTQLWSATTSTLAPTLALSPSGRYLAYASNSDPTNPFSTYLQIFSVSTITNQVSLIWAADINAKIQSLQISRDDKILAFSGVVNGSSGSASASGIVQWYKLQTSQRIGTWTTTTITTVFQTSIADQGQFFSLLGSSSYYVLDISASTASVALQVTENSMSDPSLRLEAFGDYALYTSNNYAVMYGYDEHEELYIQSWNVSLQPSAGIWTSLVTDSVAAVGGFDYRSLKAYVVLLNTINGQRVWQWNGADGHGGVNEMRLSKDGKMMVLGLSEGGNEGNQPQVVVLNAGTGELVWSETTSEIFSVAIVSAGNGGGYLLSGCGGRTHHEQTGELFVVQLQ